MFIQSKRRKNSDLVLEHVVVPESIVYVLMWLKSLRLELLVSRFCHLIVFPRDLCYKFYHFRLKYLEFNERFDGINIAMDGWNKPNLDGINKISTY